MLNSTEIYTAGVINFPTQDPAQELDDLYSSSEEMNQYLSTIEQGEWGEEEFEMSDDLEINFERIMVLEEIISLKNPVSKFDCTNFKET